MISFTWTQAKAAYEKGEREFLVSPRYPMYPKQKGCVRCLNGCSEVHFHHRDTNYLMLRCSNCKTELKGGLYEVGIKDHPVNRKRMFSDYMRWEIFKRDGMRCVVCGAGPQDDTLEADHIWPHWMGGPTIIENGVTLCRQCNAGKSGKFELEFILRQLLRVNMTDAEKESGSPDTAFNVLKRVAGYLKTWNTGEVA